VLLVHGAGGSSAIWLPTLYRLARVRRSVAVDLPGHGREPGAPRGFDQLLLALGGQAAHLCLGRSILVGHSMGGLLALAAALAWPDRVAGLILVTTSARFQVSARLFATVDNDFPGWVDFLAEHAFAPETPADVRRRGAGISAQASKEQTRADFEACTQFDARPRLGEIAVPTLVVTGTRDRMAMPKWGDELAAGIPGAEHLRLPCGHHPMFEQPDAFHAAVLAHVNKIP
jgi:3-oxoadipate enol-lactonase